LTNTANDIKVSLGYPHISSYATLEYIAIIGNSRDILQDK